MEQDLNLNNPDGAELSRLKSDFLTVGIGASAGGIKALSDFFERVPETSGIAYVIILHLSPNHDSQLAEILQEKSRIPVTQVRESIKIEPNHVYVIPPDKSLTVADGHLALSEITSFEERRAPVDIFFRSLAEAHGSRAVCVVLSGTGANGSMGLKRVKERGGIVLIQDPHEAEFDEMPRNSMATGFVDYVLPVAEIPAQIIGYQEHSARTNIISEWPFKGDAEDANEKALREIFAQMRRRTGHDFTNYKRPTLLRRIERRLNVRQLADLPSYAGFLREEPEETQFLLKDLLISVTNFFRDRAAFEKLELEVLPRIFHGKTAGDTVRAWVAGCATGEEAYSLAMLLAERSFENSDYPVVQIFATDIDERAIAHARSGFYSDTDVADVAPERLRRFFVKEANGYRVKREIRESVLFAVHNVIKDPAFSNLDLVTCRNLLIYLDRTAQQRVIQTFHFALKPGGFLFLGSSESLEQASDGFATIDKENRFFQSRRIAAPRQFPIPNISPTLNFDRPRLEAPFKLRAATSIAHSTDQSSYAIHQKLLERYAPPSIVVNEQYDIIHLSERAGRFLQVPGGEFTNNLLQLIRSELRAELRVALYQAGQRRETVRVDQIQSNTDEGIEIINLIVNPALDETEPARNCFLIVFEKAEEATNRADSQSVRAASIKVEEIGFNEPLEKQYEKELADLRAELRLRIEQCQVQNEEMKASNEELQAMNEELRSASEELEASKEELQSLNEELTTVNQELKIKIEELSQANSDFQNLMSATKIATIFLDRELRIKHFTPPAQEIFNVLPVDLGRPLADITNKLVASNLFSDVERVLSTLQTIEREVETNENRWYLMQLLPYRTLDNRINGVVISFVDITERKRAEVALRKSEARQAFLLELADALSPLTDPLEIQLAALRVLGLYLKVDRVLYADIDEQRNEAVIADNYVNNVEKLVGRIPLSSFGHSAETLRAGQVIVISDVNTDPAMSAAERASFTELGIVSAIGVPLVKGGRWISNLGVHHFKAREWSEDDIFLLRETAERTWAAVTRARVEEALAASEEKYRMLFNSIDEGFNVIEVIFNEQDKPIDYRILEINPSQEKMTGLQRDVVGKRVREFIPTIEESLIERFGQVALTGESVRFENYVSGLGRWFDIYASRVGGEGSRTVALVFNDITVTKRAQDALRESEERLRLVMQSVGDYAIITSNINNIIVDWNAGAEKTFGWTAQEVIGQSGDTIFTPEDRAAREPEKEMETALRTGRAEDERWHVRKDNSRFFVSGILTPLHRGGEPLGFVKIARDLTERREFEEELRRSREDLGARVQERTFELANTNEALQAEIVERMQAEEERINLLRQLVTIQEDERQRIARDLHDQLGQQLTGLRLKLQMLKDMCNDEKLCQGIDEMQSFAKQLDEDVDFLTWELRPTALDDLGLAAALSNFVREWSKHFGIPADIHASDFKGKRLSPEAEINLYRIAQEALNNVYKHAQATNVAVLLEFRDGFAALIVEDDGVGFNPIKPGFLNKNYQGMGLIGMHERAALIGGSLEIESEPGRGTTIYARVPVSEQAMQKENENND